jgi:L-ascorbate metabolism protein UlaG (beta-lactamase superfamily)
MNKLMITLIILFSLVVVNILYFRFAPQMGGEAKGKRLERIMASPNFKNNFFQNPVKTSMDIPPMKVFKEFFSKGIDRNPSKPIETLPINIKIYNKASDDEVIITWLGHSTLLIKTGGITILTDPVFSERAFMTSFFGPKKFEYTIDYKLDDLPPIDIVIISHDHYDHLDYQTIKTLKKTVKKFFMPLGVGADFERWGVDADKIVELDWWKSVNYLNLELVATPTCHFTGRKLNDRFKTLWCGWVIKSDKKSLYFSGDSGYWEGFKKIGEQYGPFDFTMIECGQYSPYWPTIHMAPEESIQAAIDLKSKVAMPIHWGKFKLSLHSWYEPPTRFMAKAELENLIVAIPRIGETIKLVNLPREEWWSN